MFIQNPDCPVDPCMGELRALGQAEVSLARKMPGDLFYGHRVLERLEDEDGEVVFVLEGPHDPIEVLP